MYKNPEGCVLDQEAIEHKFKSLGVDEEEFKKLFGAKRINADGWVVNMLSFIAELDYQRIDTPKSLSGYIYPTSSNTIRNPSGFSIFFP